MAKKSKKKLQRPQIRERRDRPPTNGEDRRSLAVTVAWMMSTLATAGALVLAAVAFLLMRVWRINLDQPSPLGALPGMMLFIAIITGSLALGLIPLVYRLRQVAPPPVVTIGSACVATTPWIVVLIVWSQSIDWR